MIKKYKRQIMMKRYEQIALDLQKIVDDKLKKK